jgi:hypothetical protein
MLLLTLASHPFTPVEAVEALDSPDVNAYSFADDTQLCGPVQTVLAVEQLFNMKAGLEFRAWKLLLGSEAPHVTAAELTAREFHGTVEVVGGRADGGLEMGEPGGGKAGMRVMGGPVGNAAYAAEYVKAVVGKHKKRLKYNNLARCC